MKFCSHCGGELLDEAVVCPKCGCAVPAMVVAPKDLPKNKFCSHCGAEILQEAVICPKCGCPVKATPRVVGHKSSSSGLQTAAKILMIISCVGACALTVFMTIFGLVMVQVYPETFGVAGLLGSLIYIVPLIWMIPMTQTYINAIKRNEPVSTSFKVCTLLFVSLIAGILMLCDNNQSNH